MASCTGSRDEGQEGDNTLSLLTIHSKVLLYSAVKDVSERD